MYIIDKIKLACSSVKDASERNEKTKKSLRLLAFQLSLLPIPIIQQSGMMLDRFFSDKDLNKRFDEVWEEISKINPLVSKVDDMEVAIQQIAISVNENEELKIKIQELNSLTNNNSEFTVLTEDNSQQDIINSIINADFVNFLAQDDGNNKINDVTVTAKKTTLHSKGNSRNHVSNSRFEGRNGAIGLNEISTTGKVALEGNSIDLFGSASIGFESDMIEGDCPWCGKNIKLCASAIKNKSKICCPHCATTSNILFNNHPRPK